jgi:hypothetical protein
MLGMPHKRAVAAAPGAVDTLLTGATFDGVERKFLSLIC